MSRAYTSIHPKSRTAKSTVSCLRFAVTVTNARLVVRGTLCSSCGTWYVSSMYPSVTIKSDCDSLPSSKFLTQNNVEFYCPSACSIHRKSNDSDVRLELSHPLNLVLPVLALISTTHRFRLRTIMVRDNTKTRARSTITFSGGIFTKTECFFDGGSGAFVCGSDWSNNVKTSGRSAIC